ncbi:D-3-phosphoglycerate dehydrogenase [Planctopirus ephydatiae]|uniref:D-3-phosphoglycerate dehydrogenase n=1 Tax=Planctopirus ephydatiae TaxID=2528019 RepID=A0A518GSS7_9PLAN|nr:phosphoglycerate dehydrogenase [Planctopirus ephydatiae]QDV31641.1 D-3-phosphoglycerate dehydrogenase [Planctopirus ephydatiae]
MYRVLITDNLSPAGLKILKETPGIEVDLRKGLTPDEVRVALHDADGIIIRSETKLTPEILKDQPRLKAIVRAGVGTDNINLPAATREGIVVMNTPAGNTTSTAEHTIAMMMALSRNIAPAASKLRDGVWDRKSFTGTQLAGKTIAIVGLGRIGLAVARRAIGLEMKILGFDPFMSVERAAEQGIELYRDIDEMITKCDYLTVHTPLSPETTNLIGAERLAKMKKGVRIINCARGGIINEAELAQAIESGHIGGAALDVFVKEPTPPDNPLLKLPQVLCTPHLAASTDEAQELVAVEAAEIMAGFLVRHEVRHAVNMAPISSAEMADMRIYLDLGLRLGVVLSQLNKSGVRSAKLTFRGEAATKKTKLISNAFAAGLLSSALAENVNIVNAEMLAHERGIQITESLSSEVSDFSTMISATVYTDEGECSVAGTIFGRQFLRLVRVNQFHLDAYLDGTLLLYRHIDRPGVIGTIGTACGQHNVNIAHMAVGRERNEPGGEALAILNLDNEPSAEALAAVQANPAVTSVQLLRLPKAGNPLPWLTTQSV